MERGSLRSWRKVTKEVPSKRHRPSSVAIHRKPWWSMTMACTTSKGRPSLRVICLKWALGPGCPEATSGRSASSAVAGRSSKDMSGRIDPFTHRMHHDTRRVAGAGLQQDVVAVTFHGAGAQEELAGDLRGG